MCEWTSCQAQVNEVGNLLIEVTEPSTSQHLTKQLSKLNKQWAECMKKTMFVSMHALIYHIYHCGFTDHWILHKGTLYIKLINHA